jgi:uncharacterized DUF497 family protein
MPLFFDWDPVKAETNARQHGVTFEEASTSFADPLSFTITDPDHSQGEQRFVLIGQTFRGRLVVVVHAERGDTIRIISARSATPGERDAHEKA